MKNKMKDSTEAVTVQLRLKEAFSAYLAEDNEVMNTFSSHLQGNSPWHLPYPFSSWLLAKFILYYRSEKIQIKPHIFIWQKSIPC